MVIVLNIFLFMGILSRMISSALNDGDSEPVTGGAFWESFIGFNNCWRHRSAIAGLIVVQSAMESWSHYDTLGSVVVAHAITSDPVL